MVSEEIFRLLGKKGVIRLLDSLEGKKRKYKELEKIIGNPSTTARRLKSLEAHGLINREVSSEKYRPVYYSLTKKGRRLLFVVREVREKYGEGED
ncbi:winged helix-turn-helix transcriptional regulator [Candidatus Pyrohabitans sp.]